jgi:hypothetical protein
MLSQISYTALGLALLAGTSAANAQTVITRDISEQPVETVVTQQPVQTVQTITTRTVRPARGVRRQVVTTTRRTIVSEPVVTTQTVAAPAVAVTAPQPLYDVAAPAPFVTAPAYPPPLYDTAAPVVGTPAVTAEPVVAAPGYTPVPGYRYVYEPDRILVIDPATNIAIQAIPR